MKRVNGPAGSWQEQYNQAYYKNVASDYGDWYDIDWLDWKLGKVGTIRTILMY